MPRAAPYRPDDAAITLEALAYLHDTDEGARLRQAVAALPKNGAEPTVAQVAALRKEYPAPPVHAALILARLQGKGAGPSGKFPELPFVWATPEALEQATHGHVARYKAFRISLLKPCRIHDLCAGIGGDALALANIAPVTAVDLSPIRTACLGYNHLQVASQQAHPLEIRTADVRDVIDEIPRNAWIHIDPARRSQGRRSARYEDLIPGPEVIERLFARVGEEGGVFVKLSPAVDFDSLPEGHLEIISHDGVVVEALLALGTKAGPATQRSATFLSGDDFECSIQACPRAVEPILVPPEALAPPPDKPVHLYEVDGAITRAGLAQDFAEFQHLMPLTVDGGYLLSGPGAPLVELPPVTPFRVHAIVPFSQIPAALTKLPPTAAGPVEVKARGNLPGIDTDQLQRTWSKACPYACTVLLFRQEGETLAAIARRPDRIRE
jgi:hypothetical protein